MRISKSLKKLDCAGFVISWLLYMNLNYSINTLLSPHPTHNFFYLLLQPCFFQPKTFFPASNLKDLAYKLYACSWRSVWTYFTGKMKLHEKKNHPRKTGFLIFKSENPIVKNILPCRDEIILHVTKEFNWNSSKYAFTAKCLKWDKFPHIISP